MWILKERRTVVVCQAIVIQRKVHRHEIQNGTNSRHMQRVNERHELLRRTISTGRRKETSGLITPTSVEGVLVERQELHMRGA